MTNYRGYHAMRARVERALGHNASHEAAADAHLRLSALHLSRALELEEVDCRVGKAAGDEGEGDPEQASSSSLTRLV